MSEFEEAMHHGYSRADYASEIEELEERYQELGCEHCKYVDYNSPVCVAVFDGAMRKCPHFKKADRR